MAQDSEAPAGHVASAVSVLTFSPLLALPAFFVLVSRFSSSGSAALDLLVSLLFGTALPISIVMGWSRVRHEELDFPDRETRTGLLAAVASVYAIGAMVMAWVGAPFWVVLLMSAYAGNTGLVMLVNRRWKASVHTTGVMGPATLLTFATGLPGLFLAGLLPFVAWSRWRLRRHTVFELVLGAALGLLATTAQVLISLRTGIPL